LHSLGTYSSDSNLLFGEKTQLFRGMLPDFIVKIELKLEGAPPGGKKPRSLEAAVSEERFFKLDPYTGRGTMYIKPIKFDVLCNCVQSVFY